MKKEGNNNKIKWQTPLSLVLLPFQGTSQRSISKQAQFCVFFTFHVCILRFDVLARLVCQ
jgi:hypothetical protein